MKIFITGGSGLLGQYLNVELARENKILTQYNSNPGNCYLFDSIKCSITDYEMLESIVENFKPDIVVHTAAVSNSERADTLTSKEVYAVNVASTKYIAQLCEKYNSKLIYTSTDLVYAGYRGSFLKEDAKLIPISLYAETKLMGEEKIRETFEKFIILRVSLQYGFGLNHSRSHFQSVYDDLKSGNKVQLFSNQFRSALSLKESSRMISKLIEKEIKNEIINLGGTERVTRYDLGICLCEEAGFDKSLVEPVTMEEKNIKYLVSDVSMNVDKLKSLGIISKGMVESVREILNEQ